MGNCWPKPIENSTVRPSSPPPPHSASGAVDHHKYYKNITNYDGIGKQSSSSSTDRNNINGGHGRGAPPVAAADGGGGSSDEKKWLKEYTYAELRSATRNFRPDTVLGEGGFGRVFKGWIDEKTLAPSKVGFGIPVAVKKSNADSEQGFKEWQGSQNETESTQKNPEREENVLTFLDSMDNYLILMDSLSSALRQGWLELASARYSMGASRVNSSLFDLKSHQASTTLQLHDCEDLPQFKLSKWVSSDDPEMCSREAKIEEDELFWDKPTSPGLLHQRISHSSELQDKSLERYGSHVSADDQAKRERVKSLSVFGTLVSPKLRATQISFETAVDMLVEISNTRALMLQAFHRVKNDKKTIE